MDKNELQQILDDHKKWLRGEGKKYADLRDANLRGANLRDVDLRDADLRGVDLRDANLRGVDLRSADLCSADLCGANLRGADLRDADLCGADLRSADLGAPTMILLCNWGYLSNETTLALMRLDASAHPDPSKFDKWANDGNCPYDGIQFIRIVNFREKRTLWESGPPPTIWEAVKMVLDEKCPGWEKKDAT